MRQLFSWLLGRRIGETRITKASPFMRGTVYHFLPVEMWTDPMKKGLTFLFHKWRWEGYRWKCIKTFEVTWDQLPREEKP